jgi:hypothetical protein
MEPLLVSVGQGLFDDLAVNHEPGQVGPQEVQPVPNKPSQPVTRSNQSPTHRPCAAERYAREKAEFDVKMSRRESKAKESGKKPGAKTPTAPEPGVKDSDQINLTDEESRIMPVTGGAFEQRYNAQAGVDGRQVRVVERLCQLAGHRLPVAALPGGRGPLQVFVEFKPRAGCRQSQLFWIIRFGLPGTAMPPHPRLKDEQMWQLVLYLRQLAKRLIHRRLTCGTSLFCVGRFDLLHCR